jgi:ribose transport system substrate-binding protein
MGYEGVKAVVDHLKGQTVPRRIDTGVAVVTLENMADPDIARLLDLELVKKWLKP